MKKLALVLLGASLGLLSCSQEESNVDVKVAGSYTLIPAKTSSCYAKKTSFPPAQDIEADYFRIASVTFDRKDATRELIVSLIKITVRMPNVNPSNPNSNPNYVCQIGGEELLALDSRWYGVQEEAKVPAGTASFATDCPLACGGLPSMPAGSSAGATMEIFGLERDVNNPTDELPVKIQTFFSIDAR